MSALSRALAPFAVFLVLSATLPAAAQNYNDLSPAELKATIENEHPAAYYILASKLFDGGERDEAVFWFYAGQLRYRTHLLCNPDLPPDGDSALFGALSEVIGTGINAYAFGDLDRLMATIDDVIAWDIRTANGFTPVDRCAGEHAQVVAGLMDLKAHIAENADTIRTERAAGGLDNR